MGKPYRIRLSVISLLAAALLLSACGVDLSGEPDIVWEAEVQALPTPTPTPDVTAVPTELPATVDSAATTAAPAVEPSGGGEGDMALASADYDAGFNLYLQLCTDCHKATDSVGPGLGTMNRNVAARVEAGLSAADYVRESIVDPGAFVVEGYENVMPSYADTLSDQDIANLAKFITELDLQGLMGGAAGASDDSSDTTDTAPLTGETFVMRGQVQTGSSDAKPLESGVSLSLYALTGDTGSVISRMTTVSDENNAYVFEEVPRDPTLVYAILADYDQVVQFRPEDMFQIDGNEAEITHDITVYDRTTDPASVAITWAEMVINFAPIESFGIEVTVTMEMVNTGDKIVTTEETYIDQDGVERYIAAAFELPPGAFHIQPMPSSSTRYFVDSADGVPLLKDTQEFYPGQVHNVSLVYLLPYENSAVIDQSFGYQVIDAWVLIPNDTVQFASTQFDTEGFWCCRATNGQISDLPAGDTPDPDKDFALVKSHSLLAATNAGDRLIFELLGRPTRTVDLLTNNPRTSSSGSDTNYLPLIFGVAGLLMISMASIMWWRQRGQAAPGSRPRDNWQPPNPHDREALLHALATLDDAYDAGLIDDDVYADRRAILGELLLPLLGDED